MAALPGCVLPSDTEARANEGRSASSFAKALTQSRSHSEPAIRICMRLHGLEGSLALEGSYLHECAVMSEFPDTDVLVVQTVPSCLYLLSTCWKHAVRTMTEIFRQHDRSRDSLSGIRLPGIPVGLSPKSASILAGPTRGHFSSLLLRSQQL